MALKLSELKKRFMRDPASVRMGSIASDLFRLSHLTRLSDGSIFNGVLTEIKLFTEWAAPDFDLAKQRKILSLQRCMTQWDISRGSLTGIEKDAKQWSRSILNISGLLKGNNNR